MIFTKREKLTRYNMHDEKDDVQFNELESLLMKRPADIIYCEKGGKLYGIISMGDIYRADKEGKDFVSVNKQFTSVEMGKYMYARHIFRDTNQINELPIVNHMNELVGEYSRWDDLISVNILYQLKSNKYVLEYLKGKKFALVKPCNEFKRKNKLMQIWSLNLINSDAKVSVINRENIMDIYDTVDYILFTDEGEKRGTQTLYKNILDMDFQYTKTKTYNEMGEEIENTIDIKICDELGYKIVSNVLRTVISSGVHVLTLSHSNQESKYCQKLQKDISDKFYKIGKKPTCILYEEFQRDFFGEIYNKKYAKKILSHSYAKTCINGVNRLKDADEETYKVKDGERRTLAQPVDFQRCIYFYGPCIIVGAYNADEHTIESFLQAKLNSKGYKVKCLNYGFWGNQLEQFSRILSTPFNKGDIVIFYNSCGECEGISNINLMNICEKYQIPATWLVDDILHCNHKLNRLYADEIFEMIQSIVKENLKKKEKAEVKDNFITQGYLERYFYGFMETHCGVNGAIVMNCNPFTLGHRYLIEQALDQVDHLIVFVVEENKSIFSFKERFAMVIEGTRDLERVTVVPSGNYILSQNTFPEYFFKIEDDDIIQNVEYDLTLFAEQIAPELNILYRFVGEELDDNVTNKYNEAMKRILPKYGINIVEIPRAKVNGKIISASLVRKKLLDGDCADVVKFIPLTTQKLLNLYWE